MLTTLCFSKPKFNASVFKSNVIKTYSLCNINKSVQRRTNKVWFSALETSSLYLMQYLLTLLLSDILQFFNTLPACPVEISPNNPYGFVYCYIGSTTTDRKWTFHPPSNRTDVVLSLKIIHYYSWAISTNKTFMPDGKHQNWIDGDLQVLSKGIFLKPYPTAYWLDRTNLGRETKSIRTRIIIHVHANSRSDF